MAERQNAQGAYNRGGHTRAASSVSYGYGYSVLPPLSVKDTLILHARFVQQGLADAFKVNAVIETLATNKLVMANVQKASLLQVVVLVSALAIKPLLAAILPGSRQNTSSIVYILFHIIWLYPLAIAATFYAGLLKTPELGERRGSAGGPRQPDYRGQTATIVAGSYKALVLGNYLLVVGILRYIPLLGGPLAFLYACAVDSYYCYEAQWIKSGWPLEERIRHLDSRWSYFIGFGFPITFLSWWSADAVVNLAIFSLFFPLYQIMAHSSIPQPLDPALPTSSMSISFLPQAQGSFSMAAAEGGEEARGRKGNPMIPIRIQVLFGADKVYSILMKAFVGGGGRKKDAGPAPTHNEGWRTDGYGHGGGGHTGGGRAALAQQYQQQQQQQPQTGAPPSVYTNGSYGQGMSSAAGIVPSGFNAQSPPRRGHAMTESSVGVPVAGGGEFVDRNLDSLIGAAQRRKKGD